MTVLVCLFSLGWHPQVAANIEQDCQRNLAKAGQELSLGYFQQVIELITEPCLAELDGEQLLLAHELLIRAYFSMDDLETTRRIISQLLKYQPAYQARFGSGQELRKLVAEERSKVSSQIDSVSLFSEDIHSAPATVFVVTADHIARRGYRDIGEVLESLPSLEITRLSGSEQVLIYPRGFLSTANDALLLRIDGVEQNDLFYGSNFLSSQYPLSHIEKVVFVYGPASTAYGPNANLGVIDIITRIPKLQAGLENIRVLATVGNRNSNRVDLYLSGAFRTVGEPLRYAITANTAASSGLALRNRSDSIWNGSTGFEDREQNQWFSARFWSENLSIGLQSWRREEGSSTDDPLASALGKGDTQWTPEQLNVFLNYQRTLSKGWKLLLKSRFKQYGADPKSSGNYRRQLDQMGMEGTLVHWSYSATQNRYKLQLTRQNPKQRLSIAMGADYRINAIPGGLTLVEAGKPEVLIKPRFHGLGVTPNQFKDRDLGLFVNLGYRLSQSWSASAGLRFDRNHSSGNATFSFPSSKSPRLGLLYKPNEQTIVKLLYAEAFLNPSLGTTMRLYQYLTQPFIDETFGNMPISPPEPRKSDNVELSVRFNLGPAKVRTALYRFTQAEVDGIGDRIDMDGPDLEFFREGDRRSDGLQVYVSLDQRWPLQLTLAYSYVDAKINKGDAWESAEFVSDQQLDLNLDYQGKRINAGLHIGWVGGRKFDQGRFGAQLAALTGKLDHYALVNGVLGGTLAKRQQLGWQIIMRNLGNLDYNHAGAFNYRLVPQPGRELAVRITYKR